MRQQSARAAGKLHGLSRVMCVCPYVYLSASVVPVPVRTVCKWMVACLLLSTLSFIHSDESQSHR